MFKCLVEISHKLVPSSNLESTFGSQRIYIISHGLDKHQIEDILKNDQLKALINKSEHVQKIHLNSSTNVDNLYDIIDHSYEEQEILQKLSSQLGLDVLRHDNILRDSDSSSSISSSLSSMSSSVELRTGKANKNILNNSLEHIDDDSVTFSNDTHKILNNNQNYGHLTKNILRMGSSCNKGASKSCYKACKKALSNVCHEYRCSVDLKSRFSIECSGSCRKKFGDN